MGVGKVKLLCETRRVERLSTLEEEFRGLNETILDCLTAIRAKNGVQKQ